VEYELLISDELRLDILEAFSWHESRLAGLGKDFELCLDAGFNHIRISLSYLKSDTEICVFTL
jgi:hypothetical protein